MFNEKNDEQLFLFDGKVKTKCSHITLASFDWKNNTGKQNDKIFLLKKYWAFKKDKLYVFKL